MKIDKCKLGMTVKSNLNPNGICYTITKIGRISVTVSCRDGVGVLFYKGISPLVFDEVKQ